MVALKNDKEKDKSAVTETTNNTEINVNTETSNTEAVTDNQVTTEIKAEKKEEIKTEKKLEKPVTASPIKPRATEDRYSVTFSFVSGTEGKDLPAEVLGLKPADKTNVEPGTNIDLPKPANVDVAGGT